MRKRHFLAEFTGKVCLGMIAWLAGTIGFAAEISCPIANVECVHAWVMPDGSEIISHKTVGDDIGMGPSDLGVYHCRTTLSSCHTDALLYFGEVGDGAVVEFIKTPDGQNTRLFRHGLDNTKDTKSKYRRFFPFFVSVGDFFTTAGEYRFDLHYAHVYPVQVGLRSGPPEVSSIKKLVLRFMMDSHFIWMTILTIAVLLTTSIWFLSLDRRAMDCPTPLFVAYIVFSCLSSLSVSGLPRTIPAFQSYANFANDLANSFTYSLFGLVALSLTRSNQFRKRIEMAVLTSFATAVIAICIRQALALPASNSYFATVGVCWLTSITLGLLSLAPGLAAGANTTFLLRPARGLSVASVVLASGFLFDVINFAFLRAKFPYLNHYIHIWAMPILLLVLFRKEAQLESSFRSDFQKLRQKLLIKLGDDRIEGQEVLNELCETVARLTTSERCSIVEINGNLVRFFGWHGKYDDVDKMREVIDGSPTHQMLQTRATVTGKLKACDGSSKSTQYFSIPLTSNNEIIGALFLTDFESGLVPAFWDRRLSELVMEVEIFVKLLRARRESRLKTMLLNAEFAKTHPVRAKSESYLLERFVLPETLQDYGFALLDLVKSVSLRRDFGNESIDGLVSEAGEIIWARLRHVGVSVNVEKGDAITVLIPKLAMEADPIAGLQRRFAEMVRVIAGLGDELPALVAKHRVISSAAFRAAAGFVRSSIGGAGQARIKDFKYLSDTSIDLAARIRSDVAMPGEVLVIGNEMPEIFPALELVRLQLPLRGVLAPPQYFRYVGTPASRGVA